jgi:hypothetical protein
LSEPYNQSLDEVFAALDDRKGGRRRRRHLTRAVLCLVTAMFSGCATIPEGELQLGPKIAEDMKNQGAGGAAGLSRGRPVYLESYAYPQMLETGDIWAGGPILVYLGREELSLDQVVGDLGRGSANPAQAGAPAASKTVERKSKKSKKPALEKTALVN